VVGSAQELLSFAEANEEMSLRAMMSCSAAAPSDGESAPGATLAAAARAAGLRAAPPQPPPRAPSAELLPEPCFVVKTRDEGGRKVFVNVCGSPRVAAPGDWADGQARPSVRVSARSTSHPPRPQVPLAVKEALEAEAAGAAPGSDPPAALRFPLACGPPRAACDAEGAPSTVVDVVFAAKVAAAAAADVRLKAFLIGLALAHVGAKHAMTLDARYKLPRRRYMDEPVRAQRVRDDAAAAPPRIRELTPSDAEAEAPPEAAKQRGSASPLFAKAVPPAPPAPPAGVVPFALSFEGRPCAALLCRAALPPPLAAACAAAAPPLRVALQRGCLQLLHAASSAQNSNAEGAVVASCALPFEVHAARATAWLERAPDGGVALLARLPVRSYEDCARDAAARPKGALDLSGARYLELID